MKNFSYRHFSFLSGLFFGILLCANLAFANVKVFPDTLKNLSSVLFAENGLPSVEISFEEISLKPKKVGFLSCNFAKKTVLKNLKFKIYTNNPSSENLNEIKSKYLTSLARIEGFIIVWDGAETEGKFYAQQANFIDGDGLNFRLKNISFSQGGKEYKFKDAILNMNTSKVVLNSDDQCITLIKK